MNRGFLYLLLWLLSSFQVTHAQLNPSQQVQDFFALSEWKLPDYFPPGPTTRVLDDYHYRYYANTDTYLAVGYDRVWLLGGEFGTDIIDVGDFPAILALLGEFPDPAGNLWTLTVSGTIYSEDSEYVEAQDNPTEYRLTFRNFDRYVWTNVPTPDLNDAEKIISDYGFSLAGEVAGVDLKFSAVAYDTATRKSLVVTFSTPHEKGTLTYYLLFDFAR